MKFNESNITVLTFLRDIISRKKAYDKFGGCEWYQSHYAN